MNLSEYVGVEPIITTSFILIESMILAPEDISRIIEMAWEDRTSFEAIKLQYGYSEADVIALMRREMKKSSFTMWRKRVHSRISIKHPQIRKMDLDILEIYYFVEDNYHLFENGPTKNLDKGIEIFSKFYKKFQCLEIYDPLYLALIEREGPGDTERAHEISKIYCSTITY